MVAAAFEAAVAAAAFEAVAVAAAFEAEAVAAFEAVLRRVLQPLF